MWWIKVICHPSKRWITPYDVIIVGIIWKQIPLKWINESKIFKRSLFKRSATKVADFFTLFHISFTLLCYIK